MLTCPYNLGTDTVEGLVTELSSAINLTHDESEIVKVKLSEFSKNIFIYYKIIVNNYVMNISQRTTNSSGTAESHKKSKFEEFNLKYNNKINDIDTLIHSNCFKKLQKISEEFLDFKTNNNNLVLYLKYLNNFKEKSKKLFKIINDNNKDFIL
jgi:enoyl-[acyl-carrier-protein] reductase (NADH)